MALKEEKASACVQALEMSNSLVFSVMLNAATELGVFHIIAKAGSSGVSAREIAVEIPMESPGSIAERLDRMLCLLASHSLLACTLRAIGEKGQSGFERIYSLMPVAKYFLQGDARGGKQMSLAAFLNLNMQTTKQLWSNGKDVILNRESQFEKVHGMSIFEYMGTNPAICSLFDQAMIGLSKIAMEEVLKTYNGFEGLSSLVDVGGGTGKCLNMIISKYPSIKGINFDLPQVIRDAPSYSGIEHVGGDMFVNIPKGDAILIKDTLHNWNDESCTKVLKNCFDALPEKGKVIVIAMLIPDVPDSSMASKYVTQADNLMMMIFQSHERTSRQYEALSKASGFPEFQVASKPGHFPVAVIEFCK